MTFGRSPRINAKVGGLDIELSYDMAAVFTLKRDYGISLGDLIDGEYAFPLLVALTRSMDKPPAVKDLARLSVADIKNAVPAITRAFEAARDEVGAAGESPETSQESPQK